MTGLERRVGEFDASVVKQALRFNAPSRVVLNHLDYVGGEQDMGDRESKVRQFIQVVERSIQTKVDWFGFSGLGFYSWVREN